MLFNEKNLRDNTDYLWENHGIMYGPEWYGKFGDVKDYPWWIPDARANTTEDSGLISRYKGFKTSLDISPGDQLVVHLVRKIENVFCFELFKLNKNHDGVYFKYKKPFCGLHDDDRYEIVMEIMAGIKDIPNVSLEYFLHYNDQQVSDYANALEDYDAI